MADRGIDANGVVNFIDDNGVYYFVDDDGNYTWNGEVFDQQIYVYVPMQL